MTKTRLLLMLVLAVLTAALGRTTFAQSTVQDFPTPIGTNEISGVIKARDIGDSRLTTYYFTFNGDQGDLFINLVTKNLTGDIEVFAVSGLRPLTRIAVYADYGENETGRAIYLRKPEKLLLRVQGRTPNDDEANFRLKFAGSFVAVRADDGNAAPEVPKVSAESKNGIRVNSVGTLLPPEPKPVVAEPEKVKDESAAPANAPETITAEKTEEKPAGKAKKTPARRSSTDTAKEPAKDPAAQPAPESNASASRRVRPTRRTPPKPKAEEPPADGVTAAVKEPLADLEKKPSDPKPEETRPAASKKAKADVPFRTLSDKKRAAAEPKPEPKPDPLASINLVIQFKDGSSIGRKMSEVFKFSVDKGVLTVILKDGGISKFQIVDVSKVTIE